MKPCFLLAALLAGVGPSLAQMPPTCILFNAGFQADGRGGVVETSDGGAAITGGRELGNGGNAKVVITKLDPTGLLEWMKVYSNSPGSPSEWGMAIISTADGGLAIAGVLTQYKTFIMKLDAAGTPLWAKTYDGPGGYVVEMYSNGFIQLADGGFALHAASWGGNENTWLMLRTDADGDVLWSDGLQFVGFAYDVAELPNGDLVFVGADTGLGNPNLVLRKDGLTGTTEWMHWYYAGQDHILDPHAVATAPDSTIVIGGYVGSAAYDDDFVLALASDGTLLWSTRIGTEEVENYQDMVRMPNGDYVLSGRLHQDTTNYPPIGSFVARLDANGQRLWSRNVEHPDVNTLWPVRCAPASDGGVLLTGYSGTSINYPQSFVKLDANGNTCPYCPSVDVGTQDTLAITMLPDQGFAVAGPWATATAVTFSVVDITNTVVATYCGITGVEEAVSAPGVTDRKSVV